MGFTLLEIIVALVLTSVVALIAYGALHVSLDARDRLGLAIANAQRARVTREILVDALRNTRTPQRAGDTTFVLDGDRLTFVAAGGGPPLDPECDWRVTIEQRSDGLVFDAVPVGRALDAASKAAVAFRLPEVTSWDVRVLGPASDEWLESWPASMITPRAITITLWDHRRHVDPPIRVVF